MKKIQQKVKPTAEDKKLDKWRGKLENAMISYSSVRNEIKQNEKLYDGTREVLTPNGLYAAKEAVNVRNICYELIESQVDSSIPMPKVIPIHEGDDVLAKRIENAIVNKIKAHRFNIMNDLMERTVPIQGGDFFLVEWDNTLGTHTQVGDVKVTELHPRQVIPQPGVTEIEKMDYIFALYSQTKDFVKKKYGVDVSDAEEDYREIRDAQQDGTVTDVVTINMVYYRNGSGIGRFTWCDNYVLEDLEDYQARMSRKCKECGEIVDDDTKECPKCGAKSFEKTEDKVQKVDIDDLTSVFIDGIEIPMPIKKTVEIDYYKPNEMPIVMRRNITKANSFLGYSDCRVIADQQEMIKKLGSKAAEKTLKGGSIVTLPEDVKIETTDKELKIVRLENPAQKSLIDVITIQPNISQDLQMMSLEYEYARSTLGITDAYQGKYDASATSGTAKQYSINQAAGRLESKRTLKNFAYAKLYEMMFKFWLAYADDPMSVTSEGINGEAQYDILDKSDFVKQDADGEYYWNDEFIFETDPTSTLLANREAMWNQADIMLQSGAFGTLGDLDTMLLYWTFKEKNNYPNAGEVKRQIEQRKQEQMAMASQQMMPGGQDVAQQGNVPIPETPMLGGNENAMPIM